VAVLMLVQLVWYQFAMTFFRSVSDETVESDLAIDQTWRGQMSAED